MATNPGNGGVSPPDKNGKGKNGKKRELIDVPYGSYDPAIQAQLEASRRGLADLRQDTKIANKWAKKDFGQSMFDIGRNWRRSKFDLKTSFGRENQKIKFQRQDLRQDRSRANEDFATRVRSIGRQFGQLGVSQEQARNAAGTLDGGTAAAAARKRAENQQLALAPISVAQGRMEEDFATKMGRIQIGQNQLRQDFATKMRRGRQDVGRSRKLTKQDYRRDKFTRGLKLSRGIREQKAGEADLLAQKIDSARQRHPGVFDKYGRKKKGRR